MRNRRWAQSGERQDDKGYHDGTGDRRAIGMAGAAGAKAVDHVEHGVEAGRRARPVPADDATE